MLLKKYYIHVFRMGLPVVVVGADVVVALVVVAADVVVGADVEGVDGVVVGVVCDSVKYQIIRLNHLKN